MKKTMKQLDLTAPVIDLFGDEIIDNGKWNVKRVLRHYLSNKVSAGDDAPFTTIEIGLSLVKHNDSDPFVVTGEELEHIKKSITECREQVKLPDIFTAPLKKAIKEAEDIDLEPVKDEEGKGAEDEQKPETEVT